MRNRSLTVLARRGGVSKRLPGRALGALSFRSVRGRLRPADRARLARLRFAQEIRAGQAELARGRRLRVFVLVLARGAGGARRGRVHKGEALGAERALLAARVGSLVLAGGAFSVVRDSSRCACIVVL